MARFLPLLLVLLWALPVTASPLEDVRQRLGAASAQAARVEGARAELARENEQLAAQIASAKSAARAPLLRGVSGGRLDDLLKQARSVAERLEALDREATDLDAQADAARAALMAALDARIAETRSALAGARGDAQRRQFETLRGLIAERQAVAQAASRRDAPARDRPVELPGMADAADASPNELRELADEVRDHTSSVRDQLRDLEDRLNALRARRRMLRAELAFVRDDALFDEDERNRQTVRLREDALQPGSKVAVDGDRSTSGRDPGESADRTGTTAGAPVADTARGAGNGAESPAPPPAPQDEAPPAGARGDSDSDGAQDPSEGSFGGDPGAPAGGGAPPGGAAEDDGDTLGHTPVPDPDPVAPAPPELSPASGFNDPVVIDSGERLMVGDALDPSLLIGEVDDLSPTALAEQIRKVEARRRELERTAKALEARSQALEKRAEDAEKE